MEINLSNPDNSELCEAETIATNECIKELLVVCLITTNIGMPDAPTPATIYNDN